MISKRLKTIAELVTEGYSVADIGTDHGYVPIYLLQNNISKKVIAVDISQGSLEKAYLNVKKAKVKIYDKEIENQFDDEKSIEGYVEFRLSDGLKEIKPEEVDSVIISGVGGILIVNILDASKDVITPIKEIIVSPHRDSILVKEYLKDIGFEIIFDEEITDKKKNYNIIKAIRRPIKNCL